MVEVREKERAIIEFTCIPDVSIEKAEELYNIGFRHLRELLGFTLDEEAKSKGLVGVLNHRILSQFLSLEEEEIPHMEFKCPSCKGIVYANEEACSECGTLLVEEILDVEMEEVHKGLLEMIDTILANPEGAKEFLEGLKEGEKSPEEEEEITK